MESDHEKFAALGVSVAFVMAQKIDGAFRAGAFAGSHRFRFPLLFDEDRRVTKAYGVYHALGIDAFRIARPAVVLINGCGIVGWIGVTSNQFEFPSTPRIIEAIEAAGRY